MSKKIVEIDSFEFEDMQILVGTDVITRELYFYIENNGKINPVSDEVKNRVLTKIFESSRVLDVVKQAIGNVGKKYLEKNNVYELSNLSLQSNLQNLHIKCNECNLQESSVFYEAFSNTINIKLPRKYLEEANINCQFNFSLQQIIAHEIGHLSVSDIKLDDIGNVITSTGFLQVKIPISKSFSTTDGNDYYRLDNSKGINENEGRGLEELFNALETDEIVNSSTSPDFAHKLDRTTKGKLRSARRNHSLEEYYEIMQSIIPSYDKARLLLLAIESYYKTIDGDDKELFKQLNNVIEQLIYDYEIRFLASKSKK